MKTSESVNYSTNKYLIMWNLNYRKINIFQCVEDEFEDTKGVDTRGVNGFRKLMKNRQHNDQTKKGQKDKQRSTKHYSEKYRASNIVPTKSRGALRCSARAAVRSCTTGDTLCVNLATRPVISQEWRKDRQVLTSSN